MDDMQSKMNAILGNPEMMQQIMNMAQSLGQSQSPQSQPEITAPTMPDMDFTAIQKLAGLAGQSNIDNNQRTLLKALIPYLSQDRITKLEKAMRAAKMANMASSILSQGNQPFKIGR